MLNRGVTTRKSTTDMRVTAQHPTPNLSRPVLNERRIALRGEDIGDRKSQVPKWLDEPADSDFRLSGRVPIMVAMVEATVGGTLKVEGLSTRLSGEHDRGQESQWPVKKSFEDSTLTPL
jgi:hypothetical protein